jgi:hypothetical protein
LIRYEIPGEEIERARGFEDDLITFISKSLRDRSRKVRAIVEALPSDAYEKWLNRAESRNSQSSLKEGKRRSMAKYTEISLQFPKLLRGQKVDYGTDVLLPKPSASGRQKIDI